MNKKQGRGGQDQEGVTSIRVAVRVRPPVRAEIGCEDAVYTEVRDVGCNQAASKSKSLRRPQHHGEPL